VKLLFDENLSRKLATRLADLYPGSLHLADVSTLEAPARPCGPSQKPLAL